MFSEFTAYLPTRIWAFFPHAAQTSWSETSTALVAEPTEPVAIRPGLRLASDTHVVPERAQTRYRSPLRWTGASDRRIVQPSAWTGAMSSSGVVRWTASSSHVERSAGRTSWPTARLLPSAEGIQPKLELLPPRRPRHRAGGRGSAASLHPEREPRTEAPPGLRFQAAFGEGKSAVRLTIEG